MKKRDMLCSLLFLAVAPLGALAQRPGRTFIVGQLAAGPRTADGLPPRPLRDALRELGYIPGKNIAYEGRFAEGKVDRLPALAAELVQLKVDVIVTTGWPSTVAAKRATSTIPIVMAPATGDAVATGLVASLAHPGGNVTGLSDESTLLSGKRMQILTEAVPGAARIAIIWNANDQGMTLRYREIEKAARVLKVELQPYEVREPADFERVFAGLRRAAPDALFVVSDNLTTMNRSRVIDFATSNRLPAMFEYGQLVRDAGGLMSYGPDPVLQFRRAASYVDRILKGAKPADLPVEQPMTYQLLINQKAANAMGISIPSSVLMRADEVIR